MARFQREGRLVSELRHPNIVEVLELGQLDGEWFISMELLEGMNLADAITARTAFGPAAAVPVLGAILAALAAAHDSQIVHRDIKPQNIFLGQPEAGAASVKVLDFGVAKVVGQSGQEQLTRSGTIIGTPEFMAPEQATGTKVDHRSDLYAVGCVAYAMLCGRPPFLDNWPMRILMKQAFEPIAPAVAAPSRSGRSGPRRSDSWRARWRRVPTAASSRRRRCGRRSRRWPIRRRRPTRSLSHRWNAQENPSRPGPSNGKRCDGVGGPLRAAPPAAG